MAFNRKYFSNPRQLRTTKHRGTQDKAKPAFMERLKVLCRESKAHPLPVRMTFIGWSKARDGSPMAVYACPFSGCKRREGWISQMGSRKPRKLWTGQHDGKR